MEVNIHEAKTHFSRLLQRVANGEEVTIARAGVPVARLVPVEPQAGQGPALGMDEGRIWIADDFDAPLPDDLLKEFYGGTLPELIDGKASPEAQMKYLLDTMVWLWSVGPAQTIGTAGWRFLPAEKTEVYLSAASSWEIAHQNQAGQIPAPRSSPALCSQALHGRAGNSITSDKSRSQPSKCTTCRHTIPIPLTA